MIDAVQVGSNVTNNLQKRCRITNMGETDGYHNTKRLTTARLVQITQPQSIDVRADAYLFQKQILAEV